MLRNVNQIQERVSLGVFQGGVCVAERDMLKKQYGMKEKEQQWTVTALQNYRTKE